MSPRCKLQNDLLVLPVSLTGNPTVGFNVRYRQILQPVAILNFGVAVHNK